MTKMLVDLSGEREPPSLVHRCSFQMSTSCGERVRELSAAFSLGETVAEIWPLYPGTDLNLRRQSFG